jgi:beta-mannanase
MLPMLTWESWDITKTDPNQGVAYSQPAYSDYTITHGKYDAYIRSTADAIKKLNCPVAIRLDQEQNGYWYPWGVRNTDETGNAAPTPARYKAMWRHIWNIFKSEGATNVLWTWSPNHQGAVPASAPNVLSKSYPGNKYVDWVAIDGYYFNNAKQTFAKLYDSTISQLRPYANSKPFLIAETGVGGPSLTPAQKASEITNLLSAVVKRKSFNGLIYFDQTQNVVAKDETLAADWRFDESPQSQAAFKAGINNSAYAAGKPGSFKKK